jgi:uncharacterized membrane protein YkvA (DUF1232 family)
MKMKFPIPFVSNWFQTWYRSSMRHPQFRWLIIAGSLLYLLSPTNLATDMIPILGWIDDGLITTLLLTEVSQFLLEAVKSRKEKAAIASDEVVTVDV